MIEKKGEVFFQYGNACFLDGGPGEGLEFYHLALSAGYDSDEMLFFMGLAYEHMKEEAMALRYIQKAIVKNPSRPDYRVKKVNVLCRLNRLEEAEDAVEELMRSEPELYDGYHMKNILLLQRKQYEAAVEFAMSAARRFPEDADLYYDYVKAVALKGNGAEALQLLKSVEKLKYYDAARGRFFLLEAEIRAELGEIDCAVKRCLDCIAFEEAKSGELNSEARFMLLNLYLTKPDFQKALEQAEILTDANLQDDYYYAAVYFRAYCTKKLGRNKEAETYYKKAVSLYRLATLKNAEAFEAYLYRAMCLKDMEQYDGALELLEFMENLSAGEIAEIYTIRADIYKSTGRETQARGELEKAYALKPQLREVFGEGGV